MPQLINLGGFVLQKTEAVRVNLLRSRDLDTPYMEVDINDQSVGSAAQDVCGKRLSSCKARFGQFAPLPYGSFPSIGLIK